MNIRLTQKGWRAAQPDKLLLYAPCIGCGAMVWVRRSGVYGIFGRPHVCRALVPAADLRKVA